MSRQAAPMSKVEALHAIIAWADSPATRRAMAAAATLEMSKKDIEALLLRDLRLHRDLRVVRVPLLGRIK